MRVRFLLGPAGSGKTWRCLEEVRTELRRDPAGPPLLFLAPKQATFQIERQLLSGPELNGFTRLRVLSLDRFASELVAAGGRLLTEEGRTMVLRALLLRQSGGLTVFRAAARLPGFARQLSLTLRDLRRYRFTASKLRQGADRLTGDPGLAHRLRDAASLLEAYEAWLREHDLDDPDLLLDRAVEQLTAAGGPAGSPFGAGGRWRLHRLWLDGFAEMTPQETELVCALAANCEESTLAFCVPTAQAGQSQSFSSWSVVGRTFGGLYERLAKSSHGEATVEELPATGARTRFAGNPALAHLQASWDRPTPFGDPLTSGGTAVSPLRLVGCPHPEAEAVMAAREVMEHVRRGGRFREVAILVRSLDSHAATLAPVFRRYGIPCFVDRRESVSHHPLAELTRYGVRLAAYGWRQEDWLGALKTGLLPAGADEVDWIENETLARGWEGACWQRPIEVRDDPQLARRLEAIRARVVAPVTDLHQAWTDANGSLRPSGRCLAQTLVRFWRVLDVAGRLEQWATAQGQFGSGASRWAQVHRSVGEQMHAWAENLGLAFADDALGLREWLPVIESGLTGLTVGVVPPALDQVLVGAVDRSRNPDLELVVVLGLNEGQFPARPAHPGLFGESDRRALEIGGMRLGPDARTQIAQERYYGYIAFTRPRTRLVLGWSDRDREGRVLAPSPLLGEIRRMFPELQPDRFEGSVGIAEARHLCELGPWHLRLKRAAPDRPTGLEGVWSEAGLPRWETLERLAGYTATDALDPGLAASLCGPVLRSSVSAMERFASCPFAYFVAVTLRAEERRYFEVDARERGSFQHEVLARFHQELSTQGRQWRDLAPDEARQRLRRVAEVVAQTFRDGVFQSAPMARFTARQLTEDLEDYVETAVRWMATYGLDPTAVELSFGLRTEGLPPWVLDLGDERRLEFRGKIDRIDLARPTAEGPALAVVLDYKARAQTPDPVLLEHGIQLQLPAYLAALRGVPEIARALGVEALDPIGAFYIGLRQKPATDKHRQASSLASDGDAFQHRGRFLLDQLPQLDSGAPDRPSGQFRYAFTKAGALTARSSDPIPHEVFAGLLRHTEDQLRAFGRRILAGEITLDPYRHGQKEACEWCELRSVCRIHPRTHRFRVLRRGPMGDEQEDQP